MRRIAFLFVLTLVVALVPAMADTWALGFAGPTITASGFVDIVGKTATSGTITFTNTADPDSPFVANLVTGSGNTGFFV
jgi:hypothetical protein